MVAVVALAVAADAAADENSLEDPQQQVDAHIPVEKAGIDLYLTAQEALDSLNGHLPVERRDRPGPADNHRRADDQADDWDSWVEK